VSDADMLQEYDYWARAVICNLAECLAADDELGAMFFDLWRGQVDQNLFMTDPVYRGAFGL
jgi:hypothetical protein